MSKWFHVAKPYYIVFYTPFNAPVSLEGKCLDVAASQYRKIREPGPTFLYRSVMFVLFCLQPNNAKNC